MDGPQTTEQNFYATGDRVNISLRVLHITKYCYRQCTNYKWTRAVRDCIRPPRRIWSGSRVPIRIRTRTPDPNFWSGWLPTFNEVFLVQGCIYHKIFMKIRSLSLEIKAKLLKNALSRNVEESFNKFLDPDQKADHFQNLTSSFLCIDTSVLKFSWRSVQ